MDEPVLTLDATRLRAEPGGQAQLSVTVRNPGHLVESFRLDVVGLDPTWWQVHPPELPVYPGQEESAVVVLSPPLQAQAPEDALPFGVRATSTLDADRSTVEEGDLEVGRVLDLQAAITPVTSRARWSGSHHVTYTNWGNTPVRLRLSVTDKDQALGFRLAPDQLTVPVGGTASARVRVRPRRPFLRGAPVHRPFQVVGVSSGSAPPPGTPRTPAARAGVPDPGRPVLDGAVLQVPILSRGVVALLALLVAAVVGLVAMGMRTGSVRGATQADVAPDAPTQLTAAGVSAQLIGLRWGATDRATGYVVQQVDEASGAVLKNLKVDGDATALDAKVDKPLTRTCYRVIALRGTLQGPPSQAQCAVSRDDQLPAPQDVKAVPDPNGYVISWTDSEMNSHVVLLDGATLGQVLAGVSAVTLPIPPGRHCLSVVAQQGTQLSSPPSEQVCLDSAGPSAQPTTGAPGAPGAPGGPGGSPPATSSSGAGTLTGWVAVVGTVFQEQPVAQTELQAVQATGASAQIVDVKTLPALQAQSGIVVVATGFTSQAEAQQFCQGLPATLPYPGCMPVQASG